MTPSTTDPRLLLHAYVDGELDPANALEAEQQLAADPALAAERERIETLRRVIAERLARESPPPGLARRVEAPLALGPPARPAGAPTLPPPVGAARPRSMVEAEFRGGGAALFASPPRPADADMVVANH